MGIDEKTLRLQLGETTRERCKLIASSKVWYVLEIERLVAVENGGKQFPTYLTEDPEGLLTASYADGSRETFVGLEDLLFHFSGRVLSYSSDDALPPPCN